MVDKYVEGVAYHEAAHTVVAAVLGLPLRQSGLRMFQNGEGLACYRYKQPDGSKNVGADLYRESTIIAALAGQIAHSMVYPPAAKDANAWHDQTLVSELLGEMYPTRAAQVAAHCELYKRSEELVNQQWRATEAIAKMLWSKPWSQEPPHEKRVEGEEVVSLLRQFGISAVLDESEGFSRPQ